MRRTGRDAFTNPLWPTGAWWLVAGGDHAYLSEAVRFIAGRDAALCLGTSGRLADSQTLPERLATVHWQRYAAQGGGAVLSFTETGLAQAARWGLRAPLERAVFGNSCWTVSLSRIRNALGQGE